METSNTVIGFDFSTQQLKAIVLNGQLEVVSEESIRFDEDTAEFSTKDGVHVHDDGVTITAPTMMWVKAVDLLLKKLQDSGKVNFASVVSLSGAGQQHGSVYWAKGAIQVLKKLDAERTLYEQLHAGGVFSVQDSPVWMDSSTTAECTSLESAVGGSSTLSRITGSRAYERFTGPQIAKIFKTKNKEFQNTERISLVSSFGACLFIGDYAPIDWADASGMNLFDVSSKDWNDTCLNACAPNLRSLLGPATPSHSIVGNISSYFCDRYGFSPECQVVAFTGDNPSSLAGLHLGPHEIIVSLGTSDTLFLWLSGSPAFSEGHVFVNPVDCKAYMGLLCYKNGSLMRQIIRDEKAGSSWDMFEKLLLAKPPGNDGNIGFYFDKPEITPTNVSGRYYFNQLDQPIESFSKEVEVRALIEGQFIAKRLHAEKMGFQADKCQRILATGGASASKPILQVLSDVFGVPVYTLEVTNSAALGGAYRAKHGLLHHATGALFSDVISKPEMLCAATPNEKAKEEYDEILSRFKILEEQISKAHRGACH